MDYSTLRRKDGLSAPNIPSTSSGYEKSIDKSSLATGRVWGVELLEPTPGILQVYSKVTGLFKSLRFNSLLVGLS